MSVVEPGNLRLRNAGSMRSVTIVLAAKSQQYASNGTSAPWFFGYWRGAWNHKESIYFWSMICIYVDS